MLPIAPTGPSAKDGERPTVFALHYLGGSAREWIDVAGRIESAMCVALDLPGFGSAAAMTGFSVEAMATHVARTIAGCAPGRWFLAGHSMGAKVACAVARWLADGTIFAPGFNGLILVAGSPPAPEPMDDEQRATMLGWFAGDGNSNRSDAQTYVDRNAEHLDPRVRERAIDDALRMNVSAWRAWLEFGSREDWSERIGTLATPTLILAGEDDPNLGPRAQRTLMAPHFTNASMVSFAETKHLLPMERSSRLARAIDEHVRSSPHGTLSESLPLLRSSRVSENTRKALLDRISPDPMRVTRALDARAYATLRAMVSRIVPQATAFEIDLASAIDRELAEGIGDGWRFAMLPPDREAYERGLATLDILANAKHGTVFALLDARERDALLSEIAEASYESDTTPDDRGCALDGKQMKRWFEDVRADAVRGYVEHPVTLARMGYSGDAYGGDGEPKSGFARIGIGERESWEPIAENDV